MQSPSVCCIIPLACDAPRWVEIAGRRSSENGEEIMSVVFLNIAYLLMLAAFIVRDIFWLRLLLISSQACFICYAVLTRNLSITLWNIGFIAVNVIQVIRVARMRKPIALSPEMEELYRRSFRTMKRREFLYFWNTGRKKTVEDRYDFVGGDNPRAGLYFILTGTVSIVRSGEEVTRIGRGHFIVDSSSVLAEGPSVVEARALGPVRCLAWDEEILADVRKASPEIFIKLQKAISTYMTARLRAALDK